MTSEVAPRRGSARGGRGGFSNTRGRGGRRINGDKPDTAPAASLEDQGEIGLLKKKYGSKVSTIKEMFPDWTDEDVVFALQETDGDLEITVERIADGTISQWGAVSKESKKDRAAKSKTKDTSAPGETSTSNGRTGFDGGRGRGRGADRSRGGRGRGAAQTNGSRKENSAPVVEASNWETPTTSADTPAAWDAKPASDAKPEESSAEPSTAAKVASSIIPDGVKKSWASMFAAPPPAPKKAHEPAEKSVEPTKPAEPVEVPTIEPEAPVPEPEPIQADKPEPVEPTVVEEPELTITPSHDELTETNLEQVPDVSQPIPTATAASTAASSWDPRNVSTGTPYSAIQNTQPQAIRPPPSSGFQASALKATGSSGRTPSYQRRVLDQEEAVRMPGNREVDRAAVQFGAFNLTDSGDDDVDGDREEPETRAQPPQHSPVAPRAALPPALQQPVSAPEAFPTPKQAPGLPAATHPTAAPGLPSPQALHSAQNGQQAPQGNGQFGQYGRYGQGAQESSLPQKPFDAFSQQAPSTQSPFEGYPNQHTQSQSQPQSGAFSSAPNEYSSYYTSDPSRNAYNNYYQQQYGLQQGSQGQQEGAAPQRSYSGYGGPQGEGAAAPFPPSSSQQPQSRHNLAGEGPASGHSTPNPASQNQAQGAAAQGGQPQPGHPQQPQAGNYPYGHPYYSSPYYAQYLNNYQQYGAGNYAGGPYGAKGGAHNQAYPGYGISPGAPYEHASSPAAGGFGGSSLHGRDSALGGGLGDYGRAGSAQSSQNPQALGSGAFGGAHDAFSRGASYQGQTQQHYSATQSNQPGAGDDLKPFGESKAANGPSPSLAQAGRPGSATNTAPGVLPPPQSQQGYGGYPAHLQQGQHGLHGSQAGSQYGGVGAAGGHQAAGQGHQNSQYGGYQAFGGQGSYYGSGQQQQQQQRGGGGWGGNYGH